MRELLFGYGIFAMYYVLFINTLYFGIILFSFRNIFGIIKSTNYSKYRSLSGSKQVPPISILVPAYGEELTIIESVRSLLALHYPEHEVIVVNDGSPDDTVGVLVEEFNLTYYKPSAMKDTIATAKVKGIYYNPSYPNLYVVDKENGGKADALNAGINLSNYELISSIDADSLLEQDALIRIARKYMENPEEYVAIGGNVRIANGCRIENGVVKEMNLPKKLLPMLQTVEYIKAFLGGRIGWSRVNGLIIVSGAFGVFRKDYVIKVGGYRGGYPGEDMNIIIKLHRYMLDNNLPYKIDFCPDAVCWTQAPDTFKILGSQRKRWGRGNLKNMLEEGIFMFMRPKYKIMGWITVPYNIIFETLSPYFRITGILALIGYGFMDMSGWTVLLVFSLINVLYGSLLGLGSLLLEELAFQRFPKVKDFFKMFGYTVLMFFGYRQLGILWRFLGHIDFFKKNNTWGTMVRTSWNAEDNKSA
ncbi:glycosyltransferase [Pontibacillus halophilus JSM 076056 = DSM 19796]|uniref:Glycosyltransferase n=1 Tax=Pontibacillus halophilus JSM 076056 = DSM 19796 TaxID=1385510 RepID=A0A0A5GIY3_9BACI|nr:glycosyltransferase [Pontibacillus halophilus]KGX91100.1 glycosyltransferase [Pontibacillus halophilus JSM 076056 = DSM 19796]